MSEIVDSGKRDCEFSKWERNCIFEWKIKNGLIEIEDIKLRKFKAENLDSGKWDCERCNWERILFNGGENSKLYY
jgi:hypothetical protein